MALHGSKLIYTINIWLNFVFGSFFDQDHLLNLVALGVHAKRCTSESDASLNLIDDGPFHWKDFKWKKFRGMGLLCCYYEKVGGTMCTAIVLYLLKCLTLIFIIIFIVF